MLLALLSSLLPEPTPTQETMLDALIQCKGDVEAAVASLSSKKRKRAVALDDWLQTPGSTSSSKPLSKRVQSDPTQNPIENTPQSRALTGLPGSTKPLSTNALALLRPPPSEASKAQPQLPPMVLSNPTLVAERTPCILHPSILPPELARRLFEVMVGKAESWKRNRWWLFERAVESPHKTSFFVRDMPVIPDNSSESLQSKEVDQQEWKEVAHYW